MDLVIMAGQSNAVGFDAAADQLPGDPHDGAIRFWWDCGEPPFDHGRHHSSSHGAWLRLGPQPPGEPLPDRPNFRCPRGGFGPEIGLARTLYQAGLTDLAVLKFAFSATGFATSHWNPGDPLHTALVARCAEACAALEQAGHVVAWRGVFWHQGESDADALDAYPARLQAFIADLRARWSAPDLPFAISVSTEKWAHNRAVGEVQARFAATAHRVWYVSDVGCGLHNSGHYDSAGTLEIGRRMARTWLDHAAC